MGSPYRMGDERVAAVERDHEERTGIQVWGRGRKMSSSLVGAQTVVSHGPSGLGNWLRAA